MQESNEFVQLPNGEVVIKEKPNYKGMASFEEAQREDERLRLKYTNCIPIPFNKIPKII